MTDGHRRRILVIKLGAIGDFFLAQPAIEGISGHHAAEHRTLLTIPPLAPLARLSGRFDEVLEDPRGRSVASYISIRRVLRAGRFDRVYDLQAQARTERYFWLLCPGPWPEWSGTARGASHPDRRPGRRTMAAGERYRRQLAPFGITVPEQADLSWLDAPVDHLAPPGAYALLVPGSSPGRPDKRWPAQRFAEMAHRLSTTGVRPVVIGGAGEAPLAATIGGAVPDALDLTGRTSLAEIAGLARGADLVLGNDTGPTHLAAAVGTPTVALYSRASGLVQAVGPSVLTLYRDELDALGTGEVAAAVDHVRARGHGGGHS